MSEENGGRIEAYSRDLFTPRDDTLVAAQDTMAREGLPSIQVPPELGRLLGILVRAVGAHRVLEIGTLGGYSAIWMARALPSGGRLITLEADAHHAEVARTNLARAGVTEQVDVRVGKAIDLLPTLTSEAPFDLAFIDADKTSYPAYLDWSLRLVRSGGLIVADNVLRNGGVVDPQDESDRAIDRFNRAAAADARIDAVILPNRGGRDGILVATVR